ncbi:hypothetical protein [Stenotrophomonas maltophilia]|uniref:hypothetical protein n=1 Tax=Stenotrophomonas maltophilia TaxID=40324 RepID=UPI00126A4569|nr:hypothetical protein [Stenotrophomonas maltophilia]
MDENNYSQRRGWEDYQKNEYAAALSEQLDQLISMAESSAHSIDKLQDKLLSIRDSVFRIYAYCYAMFGISFIAFAYFVDYDNGVYSKFFQIGILLALIFACSIMVRSALQLKSARRRLTNEMILEHHAQQELISLIDGQMRRLADADSLPLNWAILRIRVRKLERQIGGPL